MPALADVEGGAIEEAAKGLIGATAAQRALFKVIDASLPTRGQPIARGSHLLHGTALRIEQMWAPHALKGCIRGAFEVLRLLAAEASPAVLEKIRALRTRWAEPFFGVPTRCLKPPPTRCERLVLCRGHASVARIVAAASRAAGGIGVGAVIEDRRNRNVL